MKVPPACRGSAAERIRAGAVQVEAREATERRHSASLEQDDVPAGGIDPHSARATASRHEDGIPPGRAAHRARGARDGGLLRKARKAQIGTDGRRAGTVDREEDLLAVVEGGSAHPAHGADEDGRCLAVRAAERALPHAEEVRHVHGVFHRMTQEGAECQADVRSVCTSAGIRERAFEFRARGLRGA